jgi:hypothetical protein
VELERAEKWVIQDMERKRASKGHSRTGEHRGMDMERKRASKEHSQPGELRGMD